MWKEGWQRADVPNPWKGPGQSCRGILPEGTPDQRWVKPGSSRASGCPCGSKAQFIQPRLLATAQTAVPEPAPTPDTFQPDHRESPSGGPPPTMIIMSIMRTVTHMCAQRFTGYKVFHIHQLINSSQQPCEVGRAGGNASICTDVETEAQKGSMTCFSHTASRRHNWDQKLGLVPCLWPLALSADYAVLQEDPSLYPESQPHQTRPPNTGSSVAWQLSRQPCPHMAALPPLGSPVPTPPTLPVRAGCPGGGAGTSFPVFLSDPSPQGKRRERREGRKRRRR